MSDGAIGTVKSALLYTFSLSTIHLPLLVMPTNDIAIVSGLFVEYAVSSPAVNLTKYSS